MGTKFAVRDGRAVSQLQRSDLHRHLTQSSLSSHRTPRGSFLAPRYTTLRTTLDGMGIG